MLLVYGINHQTTPIHIRERLAFTPTQLSAALKSLIIQPGVSEAVIVSTCNRTEIYTNIIPPETIQQWLIEQKSLLDIDLQNYRYTHHEMNAIKHIMRVASGLDSMILGEPQVLGQIKDAYFAAEKTKTTGALFNQLFPAVFAASKDIRANTDIGIHPVSLVYAITQLSKTIFNDLTHCSVLLIGAGDTISLMATHLRGLCIKKIKIANRTIEKSQVIAESVNAQTIHMRDIPNALKTSDIVIAATTSQLPILGKGMIESAVANKKNPLLLIDLAVPRDIEPEIATLENVHLYNIDDLQTVIADNLENRQTAAKQAETLIELHAVDFEKKMRVFHVRHVITQYRDSLEKIRESEYEKAAQQLQRGIDPQIVLKEFGHQLINKIMHHPTMKIREAASEDRCAALQQIKAFFETE
ncbi:MAG TPA: glutamyl-tRNA reductase [Coxiellaceae bacterium]|nr:glutamyl-tRNA reductase [Coxiellaceae bacterium]